jgi:hypothetical protein
MWPVTPSLASGWLAEHRHLAGLAEAMAQITRDCPNCPDVPMIAFLLALAADPALTCATPPSVGRSQNRTAKDYSAPPSSQLVGHSVPEFLSASVL